MKVNGQGSGLSPELRSWIDNCLVPILVREYLAEMEHEQSAYSKSKPVKDSAPILASAEEGE